MKTKITLELPGLFSIGTDEEISDEQEEALRKVAGVEGLSTGRYTVQIRMGELFNAVDVQKECQRVLTDGAS